MVKSPCSREAVTLSIVDFVPHCNEINLLCLGPFAVGATDAFDVWDALTPRPLLGLQQSLQATAMLLTVERLYMQQGVRGYLL